MTRRSFLNPFYPKSIFITALFLCLTFVDSARGQDLEPFEVTETWVSKIAAMAPPSVVKKLTEKKKILIFSLHTGYGHWTIPHSETVAKLLAERSGYTVSTTKDIAMFDSEQLQKFDAIVLNNNCSIGDRRNLFWDVLKEDPSLTDTDREARANALEKNLIQFVSSGGGLMILHGGIVMQNKSEAFGKMVGGSFDYHPKQQKIVVKLVDAEHSMVRAFRGEGFEHIDEPYFFNKAYFDYDFRPLLFMEDDQLVDKKEAVGANIKYISWIKRFGEGRVFYVSPSHNAHSYENPRLLGFLADGIKYVMGDLACDDAPMKP
jgi:type 1 glutamine amidotransferase